MTLIKFCIFLFLLLNWFFGRKVCMYWESCFFKVKGIFEFYGIFFINNNKLKIMIFKKDENCGIIFI